jgi:hypothetical protein
LALSSHPARVYVMSENTKPSIKTVRPVWVYSEEKEIITSHRKDHREEKPPLAEGVEPQTRRLIRCLLSTSDLPLGKGNPDL